MSTLSPFRDWLHPPPAPWLDLMTDGREFWLPDDSEHRLPISEIESGTWPDPDAIQWRLHWHGDDLLFLVVADPQIRLSSWLDEHLPSGRTIRDYVIAMAHDGPHRIVGCLPKSSVTAIWTLAERRRLTHLEIVALPHPRGESVRHDLGSHFLWVDGRDEGVTRILPYREPHQAPKDSYDATPIAQGPFKDPLLQWSDPQLTLRNRKRTQLRMLAILSVGLAAILLISGIILQSYAWLLATRHERLLERNGQSLAVASQYEQRASELDRVIQAIKHHPYQAQGHNLTAPMIRRLLNLAPEGMVLEDLAIRREPSGLVRLEARGVALRMLDTAQWLEALEESLPRFQSTLRKVEQTEDLSVSFTMVLEEKGT